MEILKRRKMCWRMGFIFCGKHPLLLTRIQVSDSGHMGPLVCVCRQFGVFSSHKVDSGLSSNGLWDKRVCP